MLNLYVAATRQNDGKTTTSLGLINVIKNYYPEIGYMKPVGQQVKLIGEHEIDKDASLMEAVFGIKSTLHDMSPIAVPKGFTEDYIMNGDVTNLKKTILEAYKNASAEKKFMIIEGTGHAGVGSVFDMCNAEVAKLLKTPVIITTCAGIGKPIDEIMLNKALFDSKGIEVLGVIINKVKKEKYEKISKFTRMGLSRLGVDVLGVVPFDPLLSNPTLKQIQQDIKGEVLYGGDILDQSVDNIIVGAMPPHAALNYFKNKVLLITPGNREDLVLTAIASNSGKHRDDEGVRGIVLTGGIRPNKTINSLIHESGIPVILSEKDTYTTAKKINNMIIKIKAADKEKISAAFRLFENHVDIDMLLSKIRNSTS